MSTLVEVNPQASPMQSMEESATYKHIFKVENKYPDRIQASCPNEYKLWFKNSVSVSLSMTLETQNVSSCNLSHRPSVFDIDLSPPPFSLSLCVCAPEIDICVLHYHFISYLFRQGSLTSPIPEQLAG